ncbi:MAG: prolyl oligopeptidase family serine peptidase, partial [Flavitalea sp.]
MQYPATAKVKQTDEYHGVKIEDPYRWLEDDNSAETKKWVELENAVTNTYLEKIPYRQKIKAKIISLYNYTRYAEPFRNKEYFYYYKNNGLQNQPVLYRTKGLKGEEELVLDPNTLSTDGTTQLKDFMVSKNGQYAAYSVSCGGSDWETYHVKDLKTMKDYPDSIQWTKLSTAAWQGNGFYYSRYPAPKEGQELSNENSNHQVWFHKIRTAQDEDKLIFEDKAHLQQFNYASTSEDEKYLFLSTFDRGNGFLGNGLWYMDRSDKEKKIKPIVEEAGNFIYTMIEEVDGKFLILTNDDAANNRVIQIDPLKPSRESWKTIVKENNYALTTADVAGGRLFLKYLKNATSRVFEYTLLGKKIREIKLPGLGEATGFTGLKEDKFVFFSFTSFSFPTTIYRYEIASGKTILFRKPKVAFNTSDYITEQVFYKSKDGTSVPMFLVHKKSVVSDGNNPTLLYGYGGFNVSIIPTFSIGLIPWLEQGGIYALANIRGGGEYGEKWHEAGMLLNKQNVFDDFTYAAEYLIDKKFTTPAKLALRGGSNGGLLVGALINQRPDLFKVAIPEVGVMDMLRFQKFTIGWNWQPEYGNINNEPDFKNLLAYSPLHNIKEGVQYPATLIITGDHDDRVVPAHSFKYAATLQEKYKGTNPVLIRID